jgi:hypothetical protein
MAYFTSLPMHLAWVGLFFWEVKYMDTFCSDDIKDLAAAMLKVQSELNPAVKDASNPFARSRYATLNSVITASREALLKNGIWVVQYPVPADHGHLGLVTRLTHASSGQWQSCLMVKPLAKPDPQGFGSALTYARRYSISAMIGLIVEDDDAESACGRGRNGNGSSVAENNHHQQYSVANQADALDRVSRLPNLQGISYQKLEAEDGRQRIIATGSTMMNKEVLKTYGFKWNPDRQNWWRYAD